ncbi:hypothetical protein V496_05436 [Pseudogymnoascus sp. VKM F-4515 (FW-2607)]|nr:hypothetical protein V496_05436 [Pseudogymnoascus sp. VKM F-4515 (FW-2607)]
MDIPLPPEYEKANEIQEFDASGQLVTTLTVLRESLAKYPKSRIDISIPKRSHSWLKSFMEIFLPAGYPNSVTEDYMEYQIYDSLQAFSSSIAGLIASRAVLEGVGVGDATASPTTVLLLSVLQDSTGRVATILFAARLGLSLEPECKRWRLVADILNDAAMILDCLSPALPKPLRVSLLSASAALRALCGVAAGSAKASLSAHFAKSGNLGELNAKDSSQETIISLLGMLTGTALIPYLITPLQTWTALLILLFIHLSTNHFAVRAVSLRTVNRQRASLLLRPLLSPPIRPGPIPSLPSNTIASPLQISERETVIHLDPSSLHDPDPAHASFVPLATVLAQAAKGPGRIEPHILLHIFAPDSYILYFDPGTRYGFIALKSSATSSTALQAWFCAMECAHLDDETWAGGSAGASRDWNSSGGDLGNVGTPATVLSGCARKVERVWGEIERGLRGEGWDVDVNALETRTGVRFSVVGGEKWSRWEKKEKKGNKEEKGKTEKKEKKETKDKKDKKEERNKGKEVGRGEPSSPVQYLSSETANSESSSPFQSPTREAATTPIAATASTNSLPLEAEGVSPSRSKLRLRKWLSSTLGSRSRGKDKDSSTPRDGGGVPDDNPDDNLSEKAALEEAASSSSDPPPPYSGIFAKEASLADEKGESHRKSQ